MGMTLIEVAKVWFHEIFYPDGKPYRTEEVEFIRAMTGKPKAPADYRRDPAACCIKSPSNTGVWEQKPSQTNGICSTVSWAQLELDGTLISSK